MFTTTTRADDGEAAAPAEAVPEAAAQAEAAQAEAAQAEAAQAEAAQAEAAEAAQAKAAPTSEITGTTYDKLPLENKGDYELSRMDYDPQDGPLYFYKPTLNKEAAQKALEGRIDYWNKYVDNKINYMQPTANEFYFNWLTTIIKDIQPPSFSDALLTRIETAKASLNKAHSMQLAAKGAKGGGGTRKHKKTTRKHKKTTRRNKKGSRKYKKKTRSSKISHNK